MARRCGDAATTCQCLEGSAQATLSPDSPEALELSEHLAMSEDALQELLDLREFIARVIELGAPDR
jgi:hypothetical protein